MAPRALRRPVIRGARFFLAHAPGLVATAQAEPRHRRGRRGGGIDPRRPAPVGGRSRLCAEPGADRRAPSRLPLGLAAAVVRGFSTGRPAGASRRDRARGGALRLLKIAISSTWCSSGADFLEEARSSPRIRWSRRATWTPWAPGCPRPPSRSGSAGPCRRRRSICARGGGSGASWRGTRWIRRSRPTCSSRTSRPR
jgi:hypothetical protein